MIVELSPGKMMRLMVLTSFLVTVNAVTYTISVKTVTGPHAQSHGYFYASALGFNGKMIDFGLLPHTE